MYLEICFLSFLVRYNSASLVNGVVSQCSMTDVKSLMEGCDRLTGLNITTMGGTVVNDHNCDVLLPKQVFTEEPLFEYVVAESKKFYTLLMIDPDAPPQNDGEFFIHLLKSNIPGLALKSMEKTTKSVGVDYRGYKQPLPSSNSGPHRYMVLLYEQQEGNNFLPSVPQRSRFHLSSWLRGKNLCGPIAATQFRLQF